MSPICSRPSIATSGRLRVLEPRSWKDRGAGEALWKLACQALQERDDLTDLLIGEGPPELDPPHDPHGFGSVETEPSWK